MWIDPIWLSSFCLPPTIISQTSGLLSFVTQGKSVVNHLNQNRRRVWFNKLISILTLQYIGFTHASHLQLEITKAEGLKRVILPKADLKDVAT